MIAVHGHSHGLAEDLLWSRHGHSHDAADHDHNQVFLPETNVRGLNVDLTGGWQMWASKYSPLSLFKIERPPRTA